MDMINKALTPESIARQLCSAYGRDPDEVTQGIMSTNGFGAVSWVEVHERAWQKHLSAAYMVLALLGDGDAKLSSTLETAASTAMNQETSAQ